MNKEELKRLLIEIRENDYKVIDNIDPFELAMQSMKYLGDTDGQLRDSLCYAVLFKWITNDEILSTKEVYQLHNIALSDDYLLYGLGNKDDDSGFKRAFTILIIACTIFRHRKDNYLSLEEVKYAFERVLYYFNKELDFRGYIKDKGWLHAICHASDALDEFALCQELEHDDLMKILCAIKCKINIYEIGFMYEEDERMTTTIASILSRNIIKEKEFIEWIQKLFEMDSIKDYPYKFIFNNNVKQLIRSIYFRLLGKSEYKTIVNQLLMSLSKNNKYS
ncbi:DUF2785 domain-containing protein [Clostridiaceae bacterium M8S5]|nr:DUF2785 domain-containing protein [Clostridiaceae bacterium M8S5]